MRVFHGTNQESAEAFARGVKPFLRYYNHTRRKAFCATTDIATARMFAVRRTPMSAWPNITGKVVEFEVNGSAWQSVVDRAASLVDESEIAIYDANALRYVQTINY